MKEYRRKRLAEGRGESTCNRELSLLRTAFNLGRKCTPPKVVTIPYFPLVAETNTRQGFLTDAQYELLRDNLPDELRSMSAPGPFTRRICGMARRLTAYDSQSISPLVYGQASSFVPKATSQFPC